MDRVKGRNFRPLRRAILATVREVLTKLRADLMVQRDYYSLNRTLKDRTDRTRKIDVQALELYVKGIQSRLPGTPALVCSEEHPGGQTLTEAQDLPDLLFIIDPIDNTDGAIHGSPCYTALSVYVRSQRTVIAAAVGDFFHNEIYYADEEREGAYRYSLAPLPDEDIGVALRPAKLTTLKDAYIAIYTLKPARLAKAGAAKTLIRELGQDGRIDCIGGAASLCRVAAGYIDATVEFAKGFQVYDLFPGAYILMKAGGLCYRPDTGDSVSLSLDFEAQDQLPRVLKDRQPFIAAGTLSLFNKILFALSKDGLVGSRRRRLPGVKP